MSGVVPQGAPSNGARPDGLVLALDAAPGVGSVALVRGREVLGARTVIMRAAVRGAPDADPLARAVDETLRGAGVRPADLAGVACGAGPGGFTGLRIAASLAKGLAHATGRPLLAAPSLAWAAATRAAAAGTWLVALDALRGESYAARVEVGDAFSDGLRTVSAYEYFGVHASGALDALAAADRAAGVLAVDADADSPPIAAGAAALAPSPVDLAAWEPAYGRLAEAQTRWEQAHGPLPTLTPEL